MQRSIFLAPIAPIVLTSCVATGSESRDGERDGGGVAVAVSQEALTQYPILQTDTVLRAAVPYGNDGTGQDLGVTSIGIANLERSLVKFATPVMATGAGGIGVFVLRSDEFGGARLLGPVEAR